ncbi:MAG TPA: 6-phosphogluconolactonase [Solirubrobacteraceae bacterium]|jgi:6-phosphogluconolactonase|nr:6-phosphogluconolactonase [Solirubrobacteraceae bacterium]
MSVSIEIVQDPAEACAELLLDVARRRGHAVMSGGSTPKRAYELAAAEPEAWRGAHVWFGDERCVGPDDERSNYRMFKEALLERIGDVAGAVVVHRIEGELGPEAAAERYETALRSAGPPPLDLLLLGIGPDGHTASLFPDQPTLDERDRLVVGVPMSGLEPFIPRVTLTLPAIASAQRIVFLVEGEGKAEIVARVFGAGVAPTPHLPSTLVPSLSDRVTLLTDAAAASRL